MRFSENWLREWVNPAIDSDTLVSQLTMLGLEVDGVEPAAQFSDGVVVAKVLSVEPHPDAKKLKVCQVDAGGEPIQIVCGAPNVAEGMVTALASVGTVMPEGMEIKAAKLRGVASQGMLCSASELKLSEDKAGLMSLPSDAPVGQSLSRYLQAENDRIIEIDLTPNRGDCTSIRGVAHDIAARNECVLTPPVVTPVAPKHDAVFPVTLEPGCGCPRYAGRLIRGIDATAQSPLWMVERLRRSGLRSISLVVDITNLVMLEFGQPMHGFDADKLKDGIVVRNACEGDTVTLLDGREVTPDDDTLLITDGNGPVAMAGIMGGDATGVSDSTVNVFFESALFTQEAILGRSRRYNCHTDSAYRYERGVDPELQVTAIERATALLIEVAGGEAGPINDVSQEDWAVEPRQVYLRRSRLQRLLGQVSLGEGAVESILSRLGMTVSADKNGWQIGVPTRRYDIAIEEDVIEEVARVYGYDQIPRSSPSLAPHMQVVNEQKSNVDDIKQLLVERGYQEAVTYSFVSEQSQQQFSPGEKAVALANPISSDLSVMRTSLWPGLVAAIQKNNNRQHARVRLFETGLKFVLNNNELEQKPMLAMAACGTLYPEHWRDGDQGVSFFDLKGDVEALFELANGVQPSFVAAAHPALHPGRSAEIKIAEKSVGWIGELHPNLQRTLGLSTRTVVFEIEMQSLSAVRLPEHEPLSRFPQVRRDLALVVDKSVSVQALTDCVKASGPEQLKHVFAFDVYAGKELGENSKSVALGLILQDISRTLNDEEVESAVSKILQDLHNKLNASLRE